MFICYVRDGEKRYNKFSHPTFTIDVQLFLPKHATGVKVGRRVDSEGMKTRHSLNQPRNVKMALFENIVLLLRPRVDVPYSLVVT